jgi:hypothetical protein
MSVSAERCESLRAGSNTFSRAGEPRTMVNNKIEHLKSRLERLDLTTEISIISEVVVTLIPEAGKARYTTKKKSRGLAHPRPSFDPERNQRDGKKRAIRTMQEIAHAHKLNRFVTLTFECPTSPEEARKKWGRAIRIKQLKPVGPYVYALEYSQEHQGLHIHALVTPQTAQNLKEHWPHGYVDIKALTWHDIDSVCAYIGKNFADINRPEGNRYYSSRGIKPAKQKLILTDEIRLYDYVTEASDGREIYSKWTFESGLGIYGELIWNPHADIQ